MTRVLITGVRGKTGVPLARSLADRPDVEVLGGSSDPSSVDLPGVVPVAFSWSDPTTWDEAVRDVDAVYLVRPDRADAPELVADLLRRVPAAAHVVLLSEKDIDHLADDDWAPRCERAVRDSGHAWTVLRPGWFMQVFVDERFMLDELVGEGRLSFPSGGQRVAWIDARDIAATAERALLDPGHDGEVHELSGPEALTLATTAEYLSTAVGRVVTHVEPTIEEALEGYEGFDRDLTEVTFARVREGVFDVVTDTVERVTGRPARSLAEFVADQGRLS